jgi:probable phosphoglycerate mutase
MSQTLPMVHLVRHGETAWTLTGQHTGRTDLPLNEEGEHQARGLAARLTALRIDRILSSPLQRARRTAELAMPGSLVECDDDLMEWNYGVYEGRRTIDIRVERPGWRLFHDGCPGGETLDAVGVRADRVIGRSRACGGNVLLFGHREILRILAVRWIGLPATEGRRLVLATGSLSVLGYDHDLTEPVMHAWNGCGTDVAGAY